jgi:hypothetical protein
MPHVAVTAPQRRFPPVPLPAIRSHCVLVTAMAARTPAHPPPPWLIAELSLPRLADAAPYVAKRQGRNRVELASVDAGHDLPGPVLPEAAVDGAGPAPA